MVQNLPPPRRISHISTTRSFRPVAFPCFTSTSIFGLSHLACVAFGVVFQYWSVTWVWWLPPTRAYPGLHATQASPGSLSAARGGAQPGPRMGIQKNVFNEQKSSISISTGSTALEAIFRVSTSPGCRLALDISAPGVG